MGGFDDLDAGELLLSKPVAQMTPDDLVAYVKHMIRESFGFTLPVAGRPERAVFTKVRSVYGADAGDLVKWVFWRHAGKTCEGQPVSHFSWASGRKWWTDRMYLELQGHRAAPPAAAESDLEARFS
jgi:hypothetical protein